MKTTKLKEVANSMKNLAVVILAAGKGKRMNNPDLPKVLARINDKPLIHFVLSEISSLNPAKSVVVIGHHGEMVENYIKSNFSIVVHFAIQEQQLGTGHAVLVSEFIMKEFDGNTLILAGDVPNITSQSLNIFINNHLKNNADISVLSAKTENPTGYGRIVRDNEGNFLKITEHKDASEVVLLIKEINSGIILADNKLLFTLLNLLTNDNKQGEYYLTDIIELAKNNDKKVFAFEVANFDEIQGVNTLEELKNAENYKNKIGE